MSELIDFARDGHMARIVLNRPDKLNALNREMMTAMADAIAAVDADSDIRVLVLTGTGPKSFCAGADILEWSHLSPVDMWKIWIRAGNQIMDSLSRLAIPVLAALNGYTLGGGLELALAADIRIAADHVRLGAPEVKLGIIPGWGGTQRLKHVIGTSRAKQMIFTGDLIPADTALAWGLVNEVVPASELAARTDQIAQAIADNAPVAVQATKALIDTESTVLDGALLEGVAGSLTAHTEDAHIGVEAFKARTTPEFKGL